MTIQQKLYFLQKFHLNEDALFSLDMQLCLMALSRGVFAFELADALIVSLEEDKL
jgi:hypothetical protein